MRYSPRYTTCISRPLSPIVRRKVGTRGVGIDPQPILMDEVYDEAALSSVMRARARVRDS
jgi:hypothetical protein